MMTSARAFAELARLDREGWFVMIVPAIAGHVGVIAARGEFEVHRQGETVASVTGEIVRECRQLDLFALAA